MERSKPLAIDLFTGLHGWSEGLVAEGFEVIGFDLEDMCGQFGHARPQNVHLVIQDVLTLHGSQFKDAALIVASPPCQKYSWMAMPWKRAKAAATEIRADETGQKLEELNRLFNACFRIQKEASIAAGRHIPMVVENVRGAIPWVGRSRWNFGSFHLWGDVPALMPTTLKASKVPGFRFDGSGKSFQTASVEGVKAGDAGWRETGPGRQLQDRAIKNNGGSWFNIGSPGQKVTGQNPDGRKISGVHGYERDHPNAFGWAKPGTSSHSNPRKAASAMIAKIPLPLSRHIARTFTPHSPFP